MGDELKIPPRSPTLLTPGPELAARLAALIDRPFRLTGATRTDGANLRKLVAAQLLAVGKLPAPAEEGSYRVLPPKAKGVPRIRREFLDTYIVTSGSSYNLQVWNRNPSVPISHIEYSDGSCIRANDVRFVFGRVDTTESKIAGFIIATPSLITERFGAFGKPTIKEQLIISQTARNAILARSPPIVFHPDNSGVKGQKGKINLSGFSIHDAPTADKLLPLERIRDFAAANILGKRIEPNSTKTRGQQLEMMVAKGLGYEVTASQVLSGGYPDIRHQALEVKVQDAATVDLGRYSPQFEEVIPECPGFTTRSVRYMIALTDSSTSTCVGLVICPGRDLANHFVYVADKSYKCQRSIPMAFFDKHCGKSAFNPSE